ncbi:Maf family protein [Bacillus timonensis]|nr:Maf family protein [Bacillus timonensis]
MKKNLILASGSPRRKELLMNQGLTFDVVVSDIVEEFNENSTPKDIVQDLALQKAIDVSDKHHDAIVLGADTIVVYENEILGKPKDKKDAFRMLKMLSGNTHQVFTGVAIIENQNHHLFFEKTDVTFWELTDDEILEYIESGEPSDKAGSYGIQQLGSYLVKQIKGDYFSVVGLPISRTMRELKRLGYSR